MRRCPVGTLWDDRRKGRGREGVWERAPNGCWLVVRERDFEEGRSKGPRGFARSLIPFLKKAPVLLDCYMKGAKWPSLLQL